MSNKICKDGTDQFFIPSGDKVAVYSEEALKIYTRTGFPAAEFQWTLLKEVPGKVEYASSAVSERTEIRIEAGASDVLYQTGAAAVIEERRGLRGQGTPGVLNATGALTAAMILSGIVTSTTATVVGTVPTGAVMDAAIDMEIDDSIDWSVIKTGTNPFTVTAAATGHTLVGTGVVGTGTAGSFRTRKTAANTFVTYRLG